MSRSGNRVKNFNDEVEAMGRPPRYDVVYVILHRDARYCEGYAVYVGHTVDMDRRLEEHMSAEGHGKPWRYNPESDEILLRLKIEDEEMRRNAEAYVIRSLNKKGIPLLNSRDEEPQGPLAFRVAPWFRARGVVNEVIEELGVG